MAIRGRSILAAPLCARPAAAEACHPSRAWYGQEVEVVSARGSVSLLSADCRLEFDCEKGLFSVYRGSNPLFSEAFGKVVVRKETGRDSITTHGAWEVDEQQGAGFRLSRSVEWGKLVYRGVSRGEALILQIGLVLDEADMKLEVESLSPLFVPPGRIWPGRDNIKSRRFYENGWQCWTPAGVLGSRRPGDYMFPLFMPRRLKAMLANPAAPVTSESGAFSSEWFGAIGDMDHGESVVLGFVGIDRALSRVRVRFGRKCRYSELEASAQFEGKAPQPEREFMSEPLAVIGGDLSGENLETYADLVAGRQEARVGETPTGWCSWYQYFTDVTAGEVRKNLHMINGSHGSLGVEVVQVDDGYQPHVGDWLETNEDFPEGMEDLAREIEGAGKVPGIWVAPFTVTRKSKVFNNNGEWVLRNKRGRPVLAGVNPMWMGRFYGLDLTHPEVLRHIEKVFVTLREYGYRFFKLDFMATGLLEGVHHDPSLTRAQAARRALWVIREAVGDDSVVIAAGGPMMLGVGILDAQRIGPDVAPKWSYFWQSLIRDRSSQGVANCLGNVFTRCFMNGRLFEADPDCVILRSDEADLTLDERRTLASAVSVLGGSVMFSDDMGLWRSEQTDMAHRMLPRIGSRPRCPDLWHRERPCCLVSTQEDAGGEYFVALVVNWLDRAVSRNIELNELGIGDGRYHVYEFWTGHYLGEFEGSFPVEGIPGHGCVLLRLTPCDDKPRMIGSNIHVLQGTAELERLDQMGRTLVATLVAPVKCDAAVTLYVPRATVRSARCRQCEAGVDRLAAHVFRIRLELCGKEELEVELD